MVHLTHSDTYQCQAIIQTRYASLFTNPVHFCPSGPGTVTWYRHKQEVGPEHEEVVNHQHCTPPPARIQPRRNIVTVQPEIWSKDIQVITIIIIIK